MTETRIGPPESAGRGETAANLRVAYLINQYPKVSHTFIRREILALERQGIAVSRFALRGWDAEVVDPADLAERDRTRHVLKGGMLPLAGAVTKVFTRRPRAAFRALRAALSMSRRSTRSWMYHLVWLAEACCLRLWTAEGEIAHLHAHFGTNSTAVAHLLHLLGGPSYSFTVHGADELDDARFLSLPRKTAAARFVVAISDYLRGQMMRHLPAAEWPRLKVVHCGLDEEYFAAAPAPLPAQPALLCIGRFCAEKGHLLLLEAFAQLDRPGLRLVLAGDGEFRPLIEAKIAELGLGERVTITGWIGGDEVRRRIDEATLLVQPSLMEGLPVVIMEAMALGRPVISTFVAGIPELVQDGRTGWLVPVGDVGSLARAMAEALDTPVKRLEEMGRAGATRARERHHIDTEAGKLAALFRASVAAQRQP